jgi:hypothetical protein
MPNRLPFRLPEFAPRIGWVSPAARETWEPRIAAISAAWLVVERESVVAGVRKSALQNVTPEELPALMAAMAGKGVSVIPLTRTAHANGYQSATRALSPGEPWAYRCAITQPQFATYWSKVGLANDAAIGELLGTPECCRRFFDRVWSAERWMDTTWPYAQGDIAAGSLNMLWRWLGVRPVSHLPCSPHCRESLALAEKLKALLPPEERFWFREILSWSVKWTALHGVAEITSPIHRMSVPTDATSDRLEVRYLGAAAKPLSLLRASDPADNGFSSLAAMVKAHDELVALAGGPYDTILDLGCGDGTLARRIPAKRRIGIEIDPARAAKARNRLDRVVTGSCADAALLAKVLSEEKPSLILAQRDRNPPATLTGRILSYSYEAGAEPPRIVEH